LEEVLELPVAVSIQTLALVAQVLVQVARVLVLAMEVLLLLVVVQIPRHLVEERFCRIEEEALRALYLVPVILPQEEEQRDLSAPVVDLKLPPLETP
jgi:hypothetical protein